MKLVAFCRN
jgi:hypothetical protein